MKFEIILKSFDQWFVSKSAQLFTSLCTGPAPERYSNVCNE